MELSGISKSKTSSNTFTLRWTSPDVADENGVIDEREMDIRIGVNAKDRSCKTLRLFKDKELGVEAKAWEEGGSKIRLVFIGDECILTDRQVVVYEVVEKRDEADEDEIKREDEIPVAELKEDTDETVLTLSTDPGIKKRKRKKPAAPKKAPRKKKKSSPPPEDILIADDDPNIFKCPNCPIVCRSEWSFNKHTKWHFAKRRYHCTWDGCGKSYAHKHALDCHMNWHTDSTPYACTKCDKKYHTSGSLARHLQTHSSERRFVCKVEGCDKKYWTRDALRKHENFLHSRSKPYECEYPGCTEVFKRPDQQAQHSLKVHGGVKSE